VKTSFLLLVLLLSACESREHLERENKWADLQFEIAKKSQEACLARGKSVITSSWDGRMSDCK